MGKHHSIQFFERMDSEIAVKMLQEFGTGHRGFADALFSSEKPPQRLGVFDEDSEDLCHQIVKTSCHIPGCNFISDTILGYEEHYNACHRFRCEQCRKTLPSAHLLDLHIQETHDSFFAVMATRKACYLCYIEECKEKFQNPEDRRAHCITTHKLPKDFRFDMPAKNKRKSNKNTERMDLDLPEQHKTRDKPVKLANSKVRMFSASTSHKIENIADPDEIKQSSTTLMEDD